MVATVDIYLMNNTLLLSAYAWTSTLAFCYSWNSGREMQNYDQTFGFCWKEATPSDKGEL